MDRQGQVRSGRIQDVRMDFMVDRIRGLEEMVMEIDHEMHKLEEAFIGTTKEWLKLGFLLTTDRRRLRRLRRRERMRKKFSNSKILDPQEPNVSKVDPLYLR